MRLARLVPVRAVTNVEPGSTPDGIYRTDRQTGLTISVDLEEDANLEEMMGKLNAAVEDMRFPFGYELDQGKRYWEQQEQSSDQAYALLLSVVFVFLIMGVLFESIAVPLSIITT